METQASPLDGGTPGHSAGVQPSQGQCDREVQQVRGISYPGDRLLDVISITGTELLGTLYKYLLSRPTRHQIEGWPFQF